MKFCSRAALAAIAIFLLGLTVLAAVPQLITYQGRLTTSTGSPVNGSKLMKFTLYNGSGTAVWNTGFIPVTCSEGLFSVQLGGPGQPVLPQSLFADTAATLGVTVDVDPEMTPRTRLTSLPFVYGALTADTSGYAKGIANNTVNSLKIVDGSISFTDIAQNGAAVGQIMKWNGSSWVAANDSIGATGSFLPLSGGTMTGAILSTGSPEIIMGKGTFGTGNFNTGPDAFIAGNNNTTASPFAGVLSGGSNYAGLDPYDTAAVVAGGYHSAAIRRFSFVGGGKNDSALNWYSVVAGGLHGVASGVYSTVGGGMNNMSGGTYAAQATVVAGGSENSASANNAAIGGGANNSASGVNTTVSGGQYNVASTSSSGVGAGKYNTAGYSWSDTAAFVGGGQKNFAKGRYSFVGGGYADSALETWATVAGGNQNKAIGPYATVSGGDMGYAAGSNSTVAGGGADTAWGMYSTVGGGYHNYAGGDRSVIGGGEANRSAGIDATIGGGLRNLAGSGGATVGGGKNDSARAVAALVGGGQFNAAGQTAVDSASVVAGGSKNYAKAKYTFVGGGWADTAWGEHATIGGGYHNYATGSRSVIAGGENNHADGWASMVPGGNLNTATGNYSFAAGERAKANDNGSFVWADNNNADVNSFGANTFTVRCTGGAKFYTNAVTPTPTAGVQLAAGGGSWSSVSDRNVKHDLQPIDGRQLLEKIAGLNIPTWTYNSQPDSIRHIGPMAQDFYQAFRVGEDSLHITSIDADGVALAAIKELSQRTNKIETLEQENRELRYELDQIKAELNALIHSMQHEKK